MTSCFASCLVLGFAILFPGSALGKGKECRSERIGDHLGVDFLCPPDQRVQSGEELFVICTYPDGYLHPGIYQCLRGRWVDGHHAVWGEGSFRLVNKQDWKTWHSQTYNF